MFSRVLKLSPYTKTIFNRGTTLRFLSLRYTESHEYINLNGNIGTVGISQHACDALGDVVFVGLPNVGDKFNAGESFGSVESVKAASDVYMPISGEVVEVNKALESSPETVNASPLKDGWFIKIKVGSDATANFNKLLDDASYQKHLADGH